MTCNQEGVSLTPCEFESKLVAFLTYIKTAIKPNQEGRALLWGFQINSDIQSKLDRIAELLEEGRHGDANELLDDTWEHFKNAQKAYIERVLRDKLDSRLKSLMEAQRHAKMKDPVEFGSSVRAWTAFLDLIEIERVHSFMKASKVSWAVIDALDAYEAAIQVHVQRTSGQAEEKERLLLEKEESDRQQHNEALGRRHRERFAAPAASIRELLTAIS